MVEGRKPVYNPEKGTEGTSLLMGAMLSLIAAPAHGLIDAAHGTEHYGVVPLLVGMFLFGFAVLVLLEARERRESDEVPPMWLDLGPNAGPDEVETFRSYWETFIEGYGKTPITGGYDDPQPWGRLRGVLLAVGIILIGVGNALAECGTTVHTPGRTWVASCGAFLPLMQDDATGTWYEIADRNGAPCCLTGDLSVSADGTTLYAIANEFTAWWRISIDAQTATVVGVESILPPAPTPTPTCVGDQNGDGVVTIDEIMVAVGNALEGCHQ